MPHFCIVCLFSSPAATAVALSEQRHLAHVGAGSQQLGHGRHRRQAAGRGSSSPVTQGQPHTQLPQVGRQRNQRASKSFCGERWGQSCQTSSAGEGRSTAAGDLSRSVLLRRENHPWPPENPAGLHRLPWEGSAAQGDFSPVLNISILPRPLQGQ